MRQFRTPRLRPTLPPLPHPHHHRHHRSCLTMGMQPCQVRNWALSRARQTDRTDRNLDTPTVGASTALPSMGHKDQHCLPAGGRRHRPGDGYRRSGACLLTGPTATCPVHFVVNEFTGLAGFLCGPGGKHQQASDETRHKCDLEWALYNYLLCVALYAVYAVNAVYAVSFQLQTSHPVHDCLGCLGDAFAGYYPGTLH